MPKPSVAVISPEFPPHLVGGLGTHVACMTRELARHARLEMVLPAHGGYGQIAKGIHIHEVSNPAAHGAEFWLDFCRAASDTIEDLPGRVNLIQCHDWMTVMAGVSAARRMQVPLVYNVHLPQQEGLNRAIEDLGLIHADAVIVNSKAVKTELLKRKLPIRRIEVIPNGVDPSVFRPGLKAPRAARILFVGRLTAQKGVEVLLRAFGVVLRKWPGAHLVVAGDGELRLFLQRFVRQLGFPDRVSFVDWQSGASLLRLYQSARLVVVPSYYEPFGIVALEAMACGRPVVASRLGGLVEIVEDGKQGYLVRGGDHLALAGRIINLLIDTAKCDEMGQAARHRALRFSWTSAATQTAALFSDVRWAPLTAAASAAATRTLARIRDGESNRIAASLLGRTG